MVGGLFYLLPSLFGATLVSLFAAFPKELIAALAGVMAEADEREAGLTFLVSVSGMSLLGLSAALWGGLVSVLVAHLLLGAQRAPPQPLARSPAGAPNPCATSVPSPRWLTGRLTSRVGPNRQSKAEE